MNNLQTNFALASIAGPLSEFLCGYRLAMMFFTSGEFEGEQLEDLMNFEFAEETNDKTTAYCLEFFGANLSDLIEYAKTEGCGEYTGFEKAGHDLFLTAAGHGCGFWDRGLGVLGDRLTEASKATPALEAYVGDDGLIYV